MLVTCMLILYQTLLTELKSVTNRCTWPPKVTILLCLSPLCFHLLNLSARPKNDLTWMKTLSRKIAYLSWLATPTGWWHLMPSAASEHSDFSISFSELSWGFTGRTLCVAGHLLDMIMTSEVSKCLTDLHPSLSCTRVTPTIHSILTIFYIRFIEY